MKSESIRMNIDPKHKARWKQRADELGVTLTDFITMTVNQTLTKEVNSND